MNHKIIIKTRNVYHKQHSRIVSDQDAMKRFIAMFSSKYFLKGKISKNFIKKSKKLDINEQTYIKEFQKYNAKRYYRLARYVPQNNLRNFVSHLHYLGNLNNIKHIKLKKNFSNIINSIYGSGNLEFVFWKQKQNY